MLAHYKNRGTLYILAHSMNRGTLSLYIKRIEPHYSGVLRTGSSTESKEFTDISMECCGVMDGLITF